MMFEKTHNPSGLKSTLMLAIALVLSGCAGAQIQSDGAVLPATGANASGPGLLTQWVVESGDNLWYIAGTREVYSTSEQWPIIYKANASQIEDADLIYPGQVLDVPRGVSIPEIEKAVQHARNRGAWAVGPIESSDQAYLRN